MFKKPASNRQSLRLLAPTPGEDAARAETDQSQRQGGGFGDGADIGGLAHTDGAARRAIVSPFVDGVGVIRRIDGHLRPAVIQIAAAGVGELEAEIAGDAVAEAFGG